jgi:hypothetical protein
LENSKRRTGRTELIKFHKGGYLSNTEAIKAFCYDCMGYYEDSGVKCENTLCPLYNVYCRLNKTTKKDDD